MNLDVMTDGAVEEWFAESGLGVTVVERCPAVACPICRPADLSAAA